MTATTTYNPLFGAILNEVKDDIKLGEDLSGKNYLSLPGDFVAAAEDAGSIASNWGDLKAEAAALIANPAADADLLAKATAAAGGLATGGQAIVTAIATYVLTVVTGGVSMYTTVKANLASAAPKT